MRKVAIMQPYFFPYPGYVGLIKNVDEFILFDTPQFIRHGWIERNRVLKQTGGWLYIKVPLVKHSRETTIKDIVIDNGQDWRSTILSQLAVYKKIAPHYRPVMDMINSVLENKYNDIVSLNQDCLQAICDYLGITTAIKVYSKMDLQVEPAQAPDEWALNICKAMGGVDEYWNPPGGQAFFDKAKYDAAGLELRFFSIKSKEYDQHRQPFESGLSIVDMLMFNSIDEVNARLSNYEVS